MKIRLLSLRCAALLSCAAMRMPALDAQQPDPPALKAAQMAQTEWLHLVDAGNYAQAWKDEDPDAQKIVPKHEFVRTMEGVLEPLGAVESREPISTTTTETLPGAPYGMYVVTQYRTQFASKPGAIETIVAKRELDGTWKVDGYHVR